MKSTCYLLYDSKAQIETNCFIAQLYSVLSKQYRIVSTSAEQLQQGDYRIPPAGSLIFSVLKQRSWRRLIPSLARYAQNDGLILYDQDPWEAYHDKASSPGIYKDLAALVPVKRYLVTSGYWADYIRERDSLPVSFVRMGVVARNCDVGPRYEDRPIEIGFQGTLHPHRKAFFERLAFPVVCRPSIPHAQFLKSVQDIAIYMHEEGFAIAVNGVLGMNGIWIKAIEVSARGCFAIRNRDLDIDSYAIDELPAIYAYEDEAEIPDIVETIRSLPSGERQDVIRHTAETIKRRNDWQTVIEALEVA